MKVSPTEGFKEISSEKVGFAFNVHRLHAYFHEASKYWRLSDRVPLKARIILDLVGLMSPYLGEEETDKLLEKVIRLRSQGSYNGQGSSEDTHNATKAEFEIMKIYVRLNKLQNDLGLFLEKDEGIQEGD